MKDTDETQEKQALAECPRCGWSDGPDDGECPIPRHPPKAKKSGRKLSRKVIQLIDEMWVALWEVYPTSSARIESYLEFVKVMLRAGPKGKTVALKIHDDIKRRLKSGEWEPTPERKRYIPHFRTYLHQRRWEDQE